MTPRFDPFALPHKGLRYALGRLIAVTGSADPADEASVRQAVDTARATLGFLRAHAVLEDEIFFPALETLRPGATKAATAEHHVLEPQIDALASLTETTAAAPEPDRFALMATLHADVARFAGSYLQHLDLEDRTVRPTFWDAYTDEELLALAGRAMATMNPEDQQASLPFILPALNVYERVAWLTGVRARMAPVYEGIMVLAKNLLDKAAYDATVARLG